LIWERMTKKVARPRAMGAAKVWKPETYCWIGSLALDSPTLPGDRSARARSVAALAGLGPGAHGARPRRRCALHSIWIDAGTRDDFYLDLGSQAFHRALLDHDVPADRIRFELFEAGHGGIDYRYPLSLAWLAQRISR
jgi:dienelactone hydrolase